MAQPLPAELRVAPLERPMNQIYTTEVLYPVTSSQRQTRWIISPNGIWDAQGTQLIVNLTVSSATGAVNVCTYPSSVGALALVKRAYLEIGGKRISSLNELGQYSTFRRQHYSPEYKHLVMRAKQGGHDTYFGSGPRSQPIQPSAVVGGWGSVGRKPNSHTDPAVTALDTTEPERFRLNTVASPPNPFGVFAGNTLTFQASINVGQQLIPFLRGLQLPIFAIKEQVALVIEWSQDVDGGATTAGDGLGAGSGHRWVGSAGLTPDDTVSHIDQDSLILASDHLMYPDAMESLADVVNGPKGYNVVFDEIIDSVVLEQGGGVAGAELGFTHQLGLGGKMVKSIVVQQQSTSENGSNFYLGQYHSDSLQQGETYNYTVDSVPYYAIDVTNPSLQFSEVCHVDKVPMQVPMCAYSLTPNQTDDAGAHQQVLSGFTQRLYQNQQQLIDCGQMHYTGVDFTNSQGQGRRMSNMPVLLNRRYVVDNGDENVDRRVRTFTTTSRVAHLKNGLVNIIE